jgi:hypothetical protein
MPGVTVASGWTPGGFCRERMVEYPDPRNRRPFLEHLLIPRLALRPIRVGQDLSEEAGGVLRAHCSCVLEKTGEEELKALRVSMSAPALSRWMRSLHTPSWARVRGGEAIRRGRR